MVGYLLLLPTVYYWDNCEQCECRKARVAAAAALPPKSPFAVNIGSVLRYFASLQRLAVTEGLITQSPSIWQRSAGEITLAISGDRRISVFSQKILPKICLKNTLAKQHNNIVLT